MGCAYYLQNSANASGKCVKKEKNNVVNRGHSKTARATRKQKIPTT